MCHQVHTNEGIQASRRNILDNLDWILQYGDATMNANTSSQIRKIEKFVHSSRDKVMRDVTKDLKHPPAGSISYTTISTRKKKPQPRLKGPAG